MVTLSLSHSLFAGTPILWSYREIPRDFDGSCGIHRTLIPSSTILCSHEVLRHGSSLKYPILGDLLGLTRLILSSKYSVTQDLFRLSIDGTMVSSVLLNFPLTFHCARDQYELCLNHGEILLGKVTLRLRGQHNVCTGFGVDSFFSTSSHSFDLINQLTGSFHQLLLSLFSFVSLCTRETFTLRLLFACSDVVLEQLSLRLQVACSNIVHKYYYYYYYSRSFYQDSLNSCFGRSVSSSSVYTLRLFRFVLFRFIFWFTMSTTQAPAPATTTTTTYIAPTGSNVLTDVKFDAEAAKPVAAQTGWTRSAREALTNEGIVKFRESFAKKVLKTLISSNLNVSSYKASEMDDKNNFFNAIGQWSSASLQIQSWMRTHFVDTPFIIMKVQDVEVQSANGTTTKKPRVHQVDSLFKIWNSLTLDEVFDSCEIYYKFSESAVESQNLNLSWEFIMANIDSDLRAIVNAELSSYIERSPTVAQSGPMAYFIIANRIIRCTTGLSHNVITGLMGMGLVHFKGENVVDCVATLRSVLLFLGFGTPRSQCPPTTNKILVDVFLRCSNPVFVQYVRNLSDFHESDIDTPEKLFSKVQVYYNELLMKPNGWIRSTKNRSAFAAELPELAAILEGQDKGRETRDAFTADVPNEIEFQQASGRSGRRNRNRRQQANAAGGVSSGNGGGATGLKDAQGRWINDRQGNPIDYTPPRPGQPNRRQKADGSNEWYCSECGRWGNHGDERHAAFLERRRQSSNNRGNGSTNANANSNSNANGNANANAGGSGSAPPSMHRATFAQPILSLLSGRVNNIAYDSDNSF